MSRQTAIRVLAIFAIVIVVVHLIWAIGNLVAAYPDTRPPIHIPAANRTNFANVVLLMDATISMRLAQLREAKDIAILRLIPSLGFGDMLTICAVGPTFGPESCTTVLQPQDAITPEVAAELSAAPALFAEHKRSSKTGVATDRLYALLRAVDSHQDRLVAARARAAAWIEAIRRPVRPGSEYCGALAVIEDVFSAQLRNPIPMDKHFLVIGDLIQDSGRVCSEYAGDDSRFPGVKVTLVFPRSSDRDWEGIMAFWGRFFRNANPGAVPFQRAKQADGYLLQPNPFAGLPTRIPTYGESLAASFQTQLRVLLFCGVAFCAATGVLLAISRRSHPAAAMPPADVPRHLLN